MSFATVVMGATTSIGGIIKAIDGAKKAKEAAAAGKKAAADLATQKEMFKGLDTSNPYANMENTMEDLTVNQKEAEFVKQQQMQGQANVMQGLRGAAGGSGIAALAQSMANQGSLNAQQAGASIGSQESANQEKQATEAGRLAGLEREGELISRQAEMGKVTSLMGMSADELATQRAMEQQAEAQKMAGIQSGVAGGITAGVGIAGEVGGKDSWGFKASEALRAMQRPIAKK
jgi:hypothetical protein